MALYSKDGVGDLVLLETVDEQSILSTLKRRYAKDLIYTHIGNVLLSVNPFKEIRDLYSEQQIGQYRGRAIFENPPHIFGLAEDTYRALCHEAEDQCVIISGESGAGKTEASKKIMQYIAAVTGSGAEIERVKNQLLRSNPVLEAFGNAKTQRNNNSSRFGKYMEIMFDYKGDPVGGRVQNFLLEKSRVISQLPDERSFHVFYGLLAGATAQQKQQLQLLSGPADYSYLNKNGCYTVERMDDREDWAECVAGMGAMGMTEAEIGHVRSILAAVLWLGNIDFVAEGADKSRVADQKPVEVVAQLLGCDKALLAQGMVQRTYSANKQDVLTPLNADQAKYTRDALAKAIYFRLFDYIVARINTAIQTSDPSASSGGSKKAKALRTIGVLDIYGFEIFVSNSFEQFCINFVNEKLQQVFIEKTIKSEQDEYAREGISWVPVSYFNNKIVCDLIESKKPAGIIAFLDEECLLGKGTDLTFLEKIEQNLKGHKHFERPREKGKQADDFIVKHYAGDVRYNVANFLDKNKDLVWKDLLLIGESSNNPVLTHPTMFPRGGAASASLARPVTAGSNFKTQVQTLMDTLSRCMPHYIRCIKPNELKKAAVFDDEMNLHQIRYLGLLENVRVRRAGFAFRQTFDRFVARYKMLCKQTWPSSAGMPATQACRAIMQELSISEGQQFQMGKSKIFVRQPVSLFTLEELRERKLHQLATLIQSIYRSYRARKWAREMREKSLGLFGRNKLRRRASVRRYYVGDYLRLAESPLIVKLLQKYKETGVGGVRGGSTVLFADEIDKINRKAKTQRRVLLLTSQAVYNLGVAKDKFKENRRLSIRAISRVSVSKQADNFVVLHCASEYDYVVICERKTEFLTALADAFKTLTSSTLGIDFSDEITVANKNKSKQKISFVKGSGQGVTHAADKENIVVTVGQLDTVNEAYLKALEFVPMKRTDPKLKPKPGYVARSEPAKVRGISITGGQGQTAGSLYGAAGNKGAASSASAASARPAAAAAAAPKELWARAVEDFVGSDSRELTFNKGDELRILSQDESGWWSSERNGVLGYAPSTYLEIITRR